MSAVSTSPTWIDETQQITETCAFVGESRDRVLAFLTRPIGTVRASLLCCSSLFGETQTHYRREVIVARVLASHGIAVTRFDYRGTGNSDDLPGGGAVTIDSMAADTMRAAHWMTTTVGMPITALLGFRVGALSASRVASELGADLALWEPVLSGKDYLEELLRAKAIADARTPLTDEPDFGGGIDVLGYVLYPTTRRSLDDATIAEFAGPTAPARRALLIQVRSAKQLRAPFAQRVARWQLNGVDTRTALIFQRHGSWFVPDRWEPREAEPETAEISSALSTWLDEGIR